jgi:hypothetical protein
MHYLYFSSSLMMCYMCIIIQLYMHYLCIMDRLTRIASISFKSDCTAVFSLATGTIKVSRYCIGPVDCGLLPATGWAKQPWLLHDWDDNAGAVPVAAAAASSLLSSTTRRRWRLVVVVQGQARIGLRRRVRGARSTWAEVKQGLGGEVGTAGERKTPLKS